MCIPSHTDTTHTRNNGRKDMFVDPVKTRSPKNFSFDKQKQVVYTGLRYLWDVGYSTGPYSVTEYTDPQAGPFTPE